MQCVLSIIQFSEADLLSVYVLYIVLEVKLIQIRENDNIKGINIADFVIKLSAYADDTYFSVTPSYIGYLFRVWGLLVIKT